MDEKSINAIISRYPYPIAILYRIVAGMDLKEEPAKGLEYILQTAEAIARLLGIIALSELTLLKEQQDIDIPAGVKSEFRKNIKRPSFQIWHGLWHGMIVPILRVISLWDADTAGITIPDGYDSKVTL